MKWCLTHFDYNVWFWLIADASAATFKNTGGGGTNTPRLRRFYCCEPTSSSDTVEQWEGREKTAPCAVIQRPFRPHFCHTLNLVSLFRTSRRATLEKQKWSFKFGSTKCSQRTSGTWQRSPVLMKGWVTCRETGGCCLCSEGRCCSPDRSQQYDGGCWFMQPVMWSKPVAEAPSLFLSTFACCFSALR